jgi:hypothetical protein
MAERPGQPPQNPLANRLAERYGMTAENADELVNKTQREYSGTTLPPVELASTPIEQAAARIPDATPIRKPEKSLSGGFLAAIFTILLIGLGVALSFQKGCFQQRHQLKTVSPLDSIQSLIKQQTDSASMPPVPPTQASPGKLPPEAAATPREEPPGTSGRSTTKGLTLHRPTLRTSSNFEAEEHLAELRANGYSRAHMRSIRKKGNVIYIVSPN